MLEHKENADSISRYRSPISYKNLLQSLPGPLPRSKCDVAATRMDCQPATAHRVPCVAGCHDGNSRKSMLDSHIRHLLDTVFKAPPGTAQPDVAALRRAAEEAPKLLGGAPEM